MSTATEIGSQTDIEILEQLSEGLSDRTPCEYGACTKDATHSLICPCTVGQEDVCAHHAQLFAAIKAATTLDSGILFDRTCQHHPRIADCTLVPY